jgi:hypothetical protein
VIAGTWDEPTLLGGLTNRTAIPNGQKVFTALCQADAASKSNVMALVGSEVAFRAWPVSGGTNDCVLNLRSNIVLKVVFDPPYRFTPPPKNLASDLQDCPCTFWSFFDVSGRLESIDWDKRTVSIVSKQEHLAGGW